MIIYVYMCLFCHSSLECKLQEDRKYAHLHIPAPRTVPGTQKTKHICGMNKSNPGDMNSQLKMLGFDELLNIILKTRETETFLGKKLFMDVHSRFIDKS